MSTPRVLRDLVYGQPLGFRELVLDLRLPEGDGAPLIVFVHGGGFRLGSRRVFVPTMPGDEPFDRIVAAGFAVASVDYRLSGEAVFPAQQDDVTAAVAWLRDAADEYAYDASRIVFWGESAGGTIAALVGLGDVAGGAANIRGIVDWYGPSDITAMATMLGQLDDPQSRESRWLGAPVGSVPDLARAASPIAHVAAGAPPFHLAHGLEDGGVPHEQSELLAAALTAEGVEVELELVPGADHLWRGDDVDRDGLLNRAIAFARRVTGPVDSPLSPR